MKKIQNLFFEIFAYVVSGLFFACTIAIPLALLILALKFILTTLGVI